MIAEEERQVDEREESLRSFVIGNAPLKEWGFPPSVMKRLCERENGRESA